MNELQVITNTIKELGINPSLSGYHYIRDAIGMMMDDMSLINAVTKKLYPTIAKKYKTTPQRVERAIRHAIATGWQKANHGMVVKLFGHSIGDKDKPTNSEFIATIADYILMTGEG